MLSKWDTQENLSDLRLRIAGEGIASLDPNKTGQINPYMARTFLKDLYNKYQPILRSDPKEVDRLLPIKDVPVERLGTLCKNFLSVLETREAELAMQDESAHAARKGGIS